MGPAETRLGATCSVASVRTEGLKQLACTTETVFNWPKCGSQESQALKKLYFQNSASVGSFYLFYLIDNLLASEYIIAEGLFYLSIIC